MLNLNRIDKKERLMRATIGLTLKQFDELLGDCMKKPWMRTEANGVVSVKKGRGRSQGWQAHA